MARFVLALLAVFAFVYSVVAAPYYPTPLNNTYPSFPSKRADSHIPKLHTRGYNTTEIQKRVVGSDAQAAARQARDFPNARVPLRVALGGAA